MITRVQRALLLAGLLLLLATGMAAATQPPGALLRSASCSSGDTVAAGGFVLHSTLGEPAAGPLEAVGDATFASGYWAAAHRHGSAYAPLVTGGE